MKTVFLIALLSLFGKEPSDNGITYRTLSWNDFRRPAPADSLDIAAVTTTELNFDYENDNGTWTFQVSAVFLPDCSFVRVKTAAILRHEQTHFSIAYLMAAECMRDITPLQGGGDAAEKKARGIYQAYVQKSDQVNDQFDRETNRSLIRKAEKEWETRIAEQLNQFTAHGRNR